MNLTQTRGKEWCSTILRVRNVNSLTSKLGEKSRAEKKKKLRGEPYENDYEDKKHVKQNARFRVIKIHP